MNHVASKGVVLFDGVCNLCNGFVQFLIRNDRKERLKFASLDSSLARSLKEETIKNEPEVDSVLFYDREQVFVRSTAAIEIMKKMGGIWSLAQIAYIFPRFLRDAIYDWVARNRYRWFGKRDECMVPTPALKNRFIE